MASTSQDFSSGQVLTDVMMDKLSQGIMAVAQSTSAVGPTVGTTELTLLTLAAFTPAQTNRRLRLRFQCRGYVPTVSGDTFVLRFKEGATVLAESHIVTSSTTGTFGIPPLEALVDNPTATAHTYSVTIQRAIGTGTATISGTATSPAFAYLEDAGQA